MTIRITITGATKSGKSTLAQEVAAALRQCGFPVDFNATEALASRERQLARLDAIKRRLQDDCACIEIREVSTKREPSFADSLTSLRVDIKRPEDTEGGTCD
jgi:hypothetical protein